MDSLALGSSPGATAASTGALSRRPSSLKLQELKQLLAAELASNAEGAAGSDAGAGSAAGTSVGATPRPPLSRPASQHLGLQGPHGQQQQQQDGSELGLRRHSSLRLTPLGGGGRLGGGSPRGGMVQQSCSDRPSPQRARLEKRCAAALQLLARIQGAAEREGGRETLPPAALRFCKGLVFASQRKLGCLLGWDWGTAFLLRRFPDGTWSAPVFLRLRAASLGLTLGVQRIQGVSVLQTEAQVRAYARDAQPSLCLDCTLPSAYVDPLAADEPVIKPIAHKDVNLPPGVEEPYAVLRVTGLIYDISLRAGLSYVDDKLHAAVYGAEAGAPVSAAQILAGLVEPPREFMPLLRALDELAGTAQLTRRTVSKFELARQLSKRQFSKKSFSMRSATSSKSGMKGPSLQQTSGETGSPPGPASLAGGSPTSTLPSGAGAGFTKLFGDVEIEFQPMHSYEQQEAEEAAAGGNGAAGASTSLAPLHGAGG